MIRVGVKSEACYLQVCSRLVRYSASPTSHFELFTPPAGGFRQRRLKAKGPRNSLQVRSSLAQLHRSTTLQTHLEKSTMKHLIAAAVLVLGTTAVFGQKNAIEKYYQN